MHGRSISQEGFDDLWEELCGKMEEEEVMEKYNIEEAKKSAYRGRGDPLVRGLCIATKQYSAWCVSAVVFNPRWFRRHGS